MNSIVLVKLIHLSLYQYLIMQYTAAKSQDIYVENTEFHVNQTTIVQEWLTYKIWGQ